MSYLKEQLEEKKEKLKYLYSWLEINVLYPIYQKNEDIPVDVVFNHLYEELTEVQKKQHDENRKQIYKHHDGQRDKVVIEEITYERRMVNKALLEIEGKNASKKNDEIKKWITNDYPFYMKKELQSDFIKNRDNDKNKINNNNKMDNKKSQTTTVRIYKGDYIVGSKTKTGDNSPVANGKKNVVQSCNNNSALKSDEILNKLNEYFEKLVTLSGSNKDDILKAIEELDEQQTADITEKIMTWITSERGMFNDEMNEKLEEFYDNSKQTDNMEMKLKFSIPLIKLLGVDFEIKYDVKKWAREMYQKHKLKIFKLI